MNITRKQKNSYFMCDYDNLQQKYLFKHRVADDTTRQISPTEN